MLSSAFSISCVRVCVATDNRMSSAFSISCVCVCVRCTTTGCRHVLHLLCA
jgi:hypothetical protein